MEYGLCKGKSLGHLCTFPRYAEVCHAPPLKRHRVVGANVNFFSHSRDLPLSFSVLFAEQTVNIPQSHHHMVLYSLTILYKSARTVCIHGAGGIEEDLNPPHENDAKALCRATTNQPCMVTDEGKGQRNE